MSELADNIREVVMTKGFSLRKFAAIADLNQANLTRMLNGKLNITVKTIDKICAAFPDINREWLMTGKGEMFLPVSQQPQMTMSESPGSVQIAHGGAERINITNHKTERKMSGDSSMEFLQRLVDRLMTNNESLTTTVAHLVEKVHNLETRLEQKEAKMREMESALECASPRTASAGQEVKNVG